MDMTFIESGPALVRSEIVRCWSQMKAKSLQERTSRI